MIADRKKTSWILERLYRAFYEHPLIIKLITGQFHRLYYHTPKLQPWRNTFWLGHSLLKCPLDCWNYQEIIFETRPDVIIESGSYEGGSAVFLASVCDLIGNGRVVTIELNENRSKPKHDRITYLVGSSVSPEIEKRVRGMIGKDEKVLVILDSNHDMPHVLKELNIYGQLVTPGSYLIVEDTNINGHPVHRNWGPGPMEAVRAFVRGNPNFEIDRSPEKFFLTFNPNGYLKRVR